MHILTPDRVEVRTEADLIAAFEAHRDHGYGQLVLVSDEGGQLSAIGEGFGPYRIEWHPPQATGTHLRADGQLKDSEVLDALREFFRDSGALTPSLTWHQFDDERAPLPARFLSAIRERFQKPDRRDAGHST
jgi:hypothetical protein